MKIFWLIVPLLFCTSAYAFNTGDIRLGVQTGQVGLLQDVGARSGGAIGYGAYFNYVTSDELIFEIGYLSSQHTRLSHSEVPIGFNYYFGNEGKLALQFIAGVTFITNQLDEQPVGLSSSGFGIYLGGGFDVDISETLKTGVQLKYVKGFEQTVQLSNGNRISSIQDNYTILLRLAYEIPSSGGK